MIFSFGGKNEERSEYIVHHSCPFDMESAFEIGKLSDA
jgi:hypothetical protein